jgi:hypothetical protein
MGPAGPAPREFAMPKFRVEALEKFIVRTTYIVEAASPEEAEAACKAGQIAYDESSIEEGDEEWIETVFVKRHE